MSFFVRNSFDFLISNSTANAPLKSWPPCSTQGYLGCSPCTGKEQSFLENLRMLKRLARMCGIRAKSQDFPDQIQKVALDFLNDSTQFITSIISSISRSRDIFVEDFCVSIHLQHSHISLSKSKSYENLSLLEFNMCVE